ncbi:hypothetical protein, partial [Streptomyces sp. NPDC057966]|uniref:hypothetical protein n=1 Tax=Streptomyces sp. NPDC057966 TaxID=3346292 RepID=UPI0036E7AEAE
MSLTDKWLLKSSKRSGASMTKRDRASSMPTSAEWDSVLADLDQAVAVARQAVEVAASGHSDRAALLNNLGSALRARFERTGDHADLDQAVAVARQAVEVAASGHSDRAALLNNLG